MNEHMIHCELDPLLAALSYVVSVLGSFTALQLAIAIPMAPAGRERTKAILAFWLDEPVKRAKAVDKLVDTAAANDAERERLIDGVFDVLLELPESGAVPIRSCPI